MYCSPNFTTKKALREAVAKGTKVTVFAPGLGQPKTDGTEYIEGPNYVMHTWYAQVTMVDGFITKVK